MAYDVRTQRFIPDEPAVLPVTPPSSGTSGSSSTPAEAYGLNDIEQSKMSEYKTGSTAPVVSQDQIYQDTLKRFQGEIDAVNQIYGQKIGEAQVQGKNRAGSANAMQARSGLLGSDYGAAQDKNIEGYNNEVVGSLNSERFATIQAILGKARTEAASEIKAKREARDTDFEKYMNLLTTSSTRKKDATSRTAKALVASGITSKDLGTINWNDPAYVGLNSADIISAFKEEENTKKKTSLDLEKEQIGLDKTKADIAKGNMFDLSEGQARYTIDPKTGKPVLLASRKKTYSPSSGSSGVYKSGSFRISNDDYAKLKQGVQSRRGSDGYLDPTEYKTLYEDWIGKGGDEGDFLKEFPPKRFVNPAAEGLPEFLKNKGDVVFNPY